MKATSVDIDATLLNRASELMGERSGTALVNIALRRLIAAKQKGLMMDAIAELEDLPDGLGAPVMPPSATR